MDECDHPLVALDLGDGIADRLQRPVGVGLDDDPQLGVVGRSQLLEQTGEPIGRTRHDQLLVAHLIQPLGSK